MNLFLVLHDLGSQISIPFGGYLSDRNVRVELLPGILIIIPLPGNAHSDSGGYIAHASAPDVLVQLHVKPNITGSHRLLRKLPDLLHRLGRHLLEGAAMESPVEVDGILASDDLVLPGFRLFHHLLLLLKTTTRMKPKKAHCPSSFLPQSFCTR